VPKQVASSVSPINDTVLRVHRFGGVSQ
jgi:hypothetical protein